MNYQAVNADVLDKTVELLFGAAMVPTVHRLYQELNAGWQNAFQDGFQAGFKAAEEQADEQAVAAFHKRLTKADNVVPMAPRELYADAMLGNRLGIESFELQHDSGDEMDYA